MNYIFHHLLFLPLLFQILIIFPIYFQLSKSFVIQLISHTIVSIILLFTALIRPFLFSDDVFIWGKYSLYYQKTFADPLGSVRTTDCRIRSNFGLSTLRIAGIWNILRDKILPKAAPRHLLWTIHFLKLYSP